MENKNLVTSISELQVGNFYLEVGADLSMKMELLGILTDGACVFINEWHKKYAKGQYMIFSKAEVLDLIASSELVKV